MDKKLQHALDQGYIYYFAYGQEQRSDGYGYQVLVDNSNVYLANYLGHVQKIFCLSNFGKTWELTQGVLKAE